MPKSVTVANRTLERGARLAQRIGADTMTLHELAGRLHEFDIVVTCTASTLPIIGKGLLERVMVRRRHRPLFIADLGVPRDVEAEAAGLDDVFLYSVDDLQSIVRENLALRREAVQHAEQLIADQAGPSRPARSRPTTRRASRSRWPTRQCRAGPCASTPSCPSCGPSAARRRFTTWPRS